MRGFNICEACWLEQKPRTFAISFHRGFDICHWCGKPNWHSIYVPEKAQQVERKESENN